MKMSKSVLTLFIATQIINCLNACHTKYSILTTAQKKRLAKSKNSRHNAAKNEAQEKAIQSLVLASAVASVDPQFTKKAQTEVTQSSSAQVIFVHSSTNTSAQKATPKRLPMKIKHPYARTAQRHDVVGYGRAKKK